MRKLKPYRSCFKEAKAKIKQIVVNDIDELVSAFDERGWKGSAGTFVTNIQSSEKNRRRDYLVAQAQKGSISFPAIITSQGTWYGDA